MIIKRNDVPAYLRNGDFFAALDPDDDGMFEVPSNCFKIDTQVYSQEDLLLLLRSLRFWNVHTTPTTITRFMMLVDVSGVVDVNTFWMPELEEFAGTLSPYFHLRNLQPEYRINFAILAKMGINIIQWLLDNHQATFSTGNCCLTAKEGDLETLRYLHDQGCPWDIRTTIEAIYGGRIDCFLYARANDCPVPEESQRMYLAASSSLHMLQHLREEGDEWEANTLCAAVSSGQLHILRYMHESGCPWHEGVCAFAARGGYLECLQYLHEHGCPWDPHVPFYAALEGHYFCLKYAHEHGCAWTNKCNIAPLLRGHWRCFCYAVWHGSPRDALVVGAFTIYCDAMLIWAIVWAGSSFCRVGVLLVLFSALFAWILLCVHSSLDQIELERSVYVSSANQQRCIAMLPRLAIADGVLFAVGAVLFVRNDLSDFIELIKNAHKDA